MVVVNHYDRVALRLAFFKPVDMRQTARFVNECAGGDLWIAWLLGCQSNHRETLLGGAQPPNDKTTHMEESQGWQQRGGLP